MTNVLCLYQRAQTAFRGENFTQGLPEINELSSGAPCPEKPSYLDSENQNQILPEDQLSTGPLSEVAGGSSLLENGLTSGRPALLGF